MKQMMRHFAIPIRNIISRKAFTSPIIQRTNPIHFHRIHHVSSFHTSTKIFFATQSKDSSKTNPYISTLRQFFLKVHPDFFHSKQEQYNVNQASFQRLTELLDWIVKYQSKEKFTPPPSTKIEFKFYVRSRGGEDKFISAKFEVPSSFRVGPQSIDMATKSVDSLILSLLKQAGVPHEEFEKAASTKFASKKKLAAKERQLTMKELREEFRKALINNLQNAKIDDLKNSWYTEILPTVEELVAAKMILVSKDLTTRESWEALKRIRDNLPEMQFYKWNQIPLMISKGTKYEIGQTGYYIIPYDFTVERFNEFLNLHYDEFVEIRKRTREKAESFEKLVSEVKQKLNLLSLQFDVESSAVINTLYTIRRNYAMFMDGPYSLNGIHLKIGDEFKLIEGLLYIKAECTDKDLREFILQVGANKLSQAREYNKIMSNLESQVEYLRNELIEKLDCVNVDLTNSKLHLIEKLQFLYRLDELAMHLRKYDWRSYVFKLVDPEPTVKIKVDERVVELSGVFDPQYLIMEADKWWRDRMKEQGINYRYDDEYMETEEFQGESIDWDDLLKIDEEEDKDVLKYIDNPELVYEAYKRKDFDIEEEWRPEFVSKKGLREWEYFERKQQMAERRKEFGFDLDDEFDEFDENLPPLDDTLYDSLRRKEYDYRLHEEWENEHNLEKKKWICKN